MEEEKRYSLVVGMAFRSGSLHPLCRANDSELPWYFAYSTTGYINHSFKPSSYAVHTQQSLAVHEVN